MFEGFWLGVIVMVALCGALAYALFQIVRYAMRGAAAPFAPSWAGSAILVLSLVGIAVAGYLTYIETQQVAAVCGPVGDCNEVQASPHSRFLGIPVGMLGMAGYAAIVIGWAATRFGTDQLAKFGWLAIFVMALFGVLFSIYLTYLELVVIDAVCIWCLSSALIMAATLFLSTGPAILALDE